MGEDRKNREHTPSPSQSSVITCFSFTEVTPIPRRMATVAMAAAAVMATLAVPSSRSPSDLGRIRTRIRIEPRHSRELRRVTQFFLATKGMARKKRPMLRLRTQTTAVYPCCTALATQVWGGGGLGQVTHGRCPTRQRRPQRRQGPWQRRWMPVHRS